MSAYIVWILTVYTLAQSSGLECNWDWNAGRIIADATGWGTRVNDITSPVDCQNRCLTRSDFLCHSVMYRSDDRRCVLFAENMQTASISTSQSGDMAFQYAYRPRCAGVWFPWSAVRGKKLSGSRDFTDEISYSNTRVQRCMTDCLQTNSNGTNLDCRSIVVGVDPTEVCERWNAREGDSGRSLEENNGNLLTINRPLLYMDDASSATNTPVIDNGGAGTSPQLFTYTHRLPASGYLIAWQYYVHTSRVGVKGCHSFADIWRERNDSSTTPISTWTLISKTQLTGYDTSGVKFQYVSEIVTRVQKDDFVGIHVSIKSTGVGGLPEGCEGNIVSFGGSPGPDQYLLVINGDTRESIRNLNPGSTFTSDTADANLTPRRGSIRAYISPYIRVNPAPTVRHEGQSLIMNWTSVSQDISLAGYRITCSHSQDVPTDLVSCHQETVVTGTQTTLMNLDQPMYARVQVVRNILGVEEADEVYSAASNIFCAVLDRPDLQIDISEGQLTPDTDVRVTISVRGLQPVTCLKQIYMIYLPTSSNEQPNTVTLNKNNATTIDLSQGIQYNFRLRIRLEDDYEYDTGVNKDHTVSTAPPAPETLSVNENTRTQTSVVLSWSAVSYMTRILSEYQVTCEVTNSTFSNPPPTNRINEIQSGTEFNATGLSPAVQYQCGVNARLENGHGVKAFFPRFWTQPQELNATWNVTNAASASGVGMIEISLPAIPSGSIYRYLRVRADQLATRKKRNTNSIVAELDLTRYNLTTFAVGDNETYGGYHNAPLATGSYKISVGFRAVTEKKVLNFYAVPGADAIQIVGPTKTPAADPNSNDGSGSNTTVIVVAVVAAVAVVVLIVIVVVVVKRRRKAGKENSRPNIYYNAANADGRTGSSTVETDSRPAVLPKPSFSQAPTLQRTVEPMQTPQRSSTLPGSKPLRPTSPPRPASQDMDDQNYENLGNTLVTKVPISQLAEVIHQEKRANPSTPFKREFDLLVKFDEETPLVGRQPANRAKNRFKNITPFDESRVVLSTNSTFTSDYINASYIEDHQGVRRYIAAQGPTPTTVIDLWRMISDLNIDTVVMLANLIEVGKPKCERYWPPGTDPMEYGYVTVQVVEQQDFAEYMIRKFNYTVKAPDCPERWGTVSLYQFSQWSDHGVPTTAGLLNFCHRVKQAMPNDGRPTLVHCSAGVGRTGTFIGLDILVRQALTKGQTYVDVFGCVNRMREQRPTMVQTLVQYSFLYDVLAEALTAGDTSIICYDFGTRYASWKKASVLSSQFKRIALTAELGQQQKFTTGSAEENVDRNRGSILAGEDQRVFLTKRSGEYINAIYADSYYNRFGVIVTEDPLPNTLFAYWSMIAERKCTRLIRFKTEEGVEGLYPHNEQGLDYDGVVVRLKGTKVSQIDKDFGIVTQKLDVKLNAKTENLEYIELTLSPNSLPTADQLIQLCSKIEGSAQHGLPPIVIQCIDGSRLSGLFLVALNLFLKTRHEQEVDIVLEVKLARRSRPEFIPSLAEFQLLYEFIGTYLAEFSDYANFKDLGQ